MTEVIFSSLCFGAAMLLLAVPVALMVKSINRRFGSDAGTVGWRIVQFAVTTPDSGAKAVGRDTVAVAGLAFQTREGKPRQDLVRSLEVGQRVFLARDRYKVDQSNAVVVLTDDGQDLGYLQQEAAELLGPILDDGKAILAVVSAKEFSKGNEGQLIGLKLDCEIYPAPWLKGRSDISSPSS